MDPKMEEEDKASTPPKKNSNSEDVVVRGGGATTLEARFTHFCKQNSKPETFVAVRPPWLKPVARAEDPREFDKEELVSVYELEGHPDYDYCYGDVVVRLSPVSVTAQKTSAANSSEEPKQLIDENEVKQDKKKHPGSAKVVGSSTDETSSEFSDLSWVGNITGLRNGDIEVIWADGMISTVGPQAKYVVGRDDDESVAGSEVSDDAVSWETVEDDEMETFQNDKEVITAGNLSLEPDN